MAEKTEADLLRDEIAWLKRELRTARDMLNGDYWFWQDDDENHLESLVCPVVIRADTLAALLKPEGS